MNYKFCITLFSLFCLVSSELCFGLSVYEIRKGKKKGYLLPSIHYGAEASSEKKLLHLLLSKVHSIYFEKTGSGVFSVDMDCDRSCLLKNDLELRADIKAKFLLDENELSKLETLKTWSIALFLNSMRGKSNTESKLGIEQLIQMVNIDFRHEVNGLETKNEILNQFDKLSKKAQRDLLNDVIYKKGSQRKINSQIMQESYSEYCNQIEVKLDSRQEFKKYLVDDRNLKWVESIKEMDANDTPLIVVGASHFCGSNGIIELLKNNNYTVKEISING